MNSILTPRYYAVFGLQIQWKLRPPLSPIVQTSNSISPTPLCSSWNELKQAVSHCQACSLHQTRTQTVFGIGHSQADLMFIGEAPGFYEDQKGEPFVGRAGQLLTAMLRTIGYERQQVYIANILKCRPPNNRDPQPTEIKACSDFLKQQIILIQPKLLIAVGRIAAHYLLNTSIGLNALRGQVHYDCAYKIPLIVTYHPAYLLRYPLEKKKAFADLILIKRNLDKINKKDCNLN